jgi:hypothetical protein
MRIYKTVQTFVVTYEVREEENHRFLDMLADQDDLSEFEVEQTYIGEQIVHAESD